MCIKMVGTGRLALPRLNDSRSLGSADSRLTTCPKSATVLKMKKLLVPVAIVGLLTISQFIPVLTVKGASTSDTEVVKALQEQNKQLARIAASLERISGQQPGWKLPQ